MEALLLFAVILFFWSAGGKFLLFGDDLLLPPLDGVTQYGCTSITLLNGAVRATVWANYDEAHLEGVRKTRFSLELQKEYPHRGWARLLSQRSGKKADQQSAQDCVLWTRTVRHALQENLKKEQVK